MKKKFILLSLVIINTFTLIGCGQSKAELKKQVKTEVKQELKEENGEVSDKDVKSITLDDYNKFKSEYNQYYDLLNKATMICLTKSDTTDKAKELLSQAKSMDEDLTKITPKVLLDDFNEYKNLEYQFIEDMINNPPVNGVVSETQNQISKKITNSQFPNKNHHLELQLQGKINN